MALPIAEFDELPLGTLRHRIRALNEDEIQTLLAHEHAHADRLPVTELLRTRLGELENGATPSPGAETTPSDVPGHSRSGSPVTPDSPTQPGRPTTHGTGTSDRSGKGIEHKD